MKLVIYLFTADTQGHPSLFLSRKQVKGSWELFEEKLGNLMCSPKDFLMNRIYWTIDCCCSCHKHAFFREIWFFMFFYLLLMILVLRKKLIPLLKNLYTFSQKCNYRPNQILLTEHNLLLNVFSMFLFERKLFMEWNLIKLNSFIIKGDVLVLLWFSSISWNKWILQPYLLRTI